MPTTEQQSSVTEEPEDEDKVMADGWMKFTDGRWGKIIDVLISHRKVNLQGSVGIGDELAAAMDRKYGVRQRWYFPLVSTKPRARQ